MPEIVTLAGIATWLEIVQVDKARHMAGDCPAGRACKMAGVLTLAGLATWPEIVTLARISAWGYYFCEVQVGILIQDRILTHRLLQQYFQDGFLLLKVGFLASVKLLKTEVWTLHCVDVFPCAQCQFGHATEISH